MFIIALHVRYHLTQAYSWRERWVLSSWQWNRQPHCSSSVCVRW